MNEFIYYGVIILPASHKHVELPNNKKKNQLFLQQTWLIIDTGEGTASTSGDVTIRSVKGGTKATRSPVLRNQRTAAWRTTAMKKKGN